MKVYFLGAYSEKGRAGMMDSSYDARVSAVSAMLAKAGAKLGSVDYLQGDWDVIADAQVDCYETASGIHARHNPYYIRTVRGDKKDPLTKMMVDAGFPVEDDVMKNGILLGCHHGMSISDVNYICKVFIKFLNKCK